MGEAKWYLVNTIGWKNQIKNPYQMITESPSFFNGLQDFKRYDGRTLRSSICKKNLPNRIQKQFIQCLPVSREYFIPVGDTLHIFEQSLQWKIINLLRCRSKKENYQ